MVDQPILPEDKNKQPKQDSIVEGLLSGKYKVGSIDYDRPTTSPVEMSTYDEGRTGWYEDQGMLNSLRAKNQPWYSELGSALGRTVGDVLIGQTLVGVGALGEIPDIIHSEVTGTPNDFSNWLIDLGNNVSEWSRENMPIYRENPGKSFDMSDTAWWMEGLPNAASTISMFLPAGAAMKGLSAIGKLKMIQGVLSKMNPMLLKGLGMITHAGLMRSMEGVMEANGAYKTIYDNTLSEISQDPNTYIQNFLQTEEGQDYLKEGFNPEDPETVAKYIAGKGAMRSFNLNMGNIVFDLAQLGTMYKSMSAIGSWGMLDNIGTSKKVLKTAGLWDKMSKTEKFLNYSTNNIIFNSLNEIPEEMWNTISTKEGERYAQGLLAGKSNSWYDVFDTDVLGNYLKDGEVLESGFWGAFGGAMFGAGSKYLGKVHNKLTTGSWDTLDRDDIRVKEIVERKQFFDKITKEIKDISEGNVVEDSFGNTVADYSKLTEQEKKDAISARKSSLGIDLGARLASTGNAELFVEQMRQDPTAFVKQLVETGLVSEEEAQKETQYLMNEITEGANTYKKYSNNRVFNVVSDFTKQNILNNIMQVEAAKAKYKKIYEVNNQRVAPLVKEKPMSVKEQTNKDQINSVRETAVRTLAAQQLEKGLEARIEQFTKEAQASNITPENKAVLENKIESLSKTLKEVKALKGTDLNPNTRLEEVDNGYKTTYLETSVDEQGNEVTKEASLVIDDSYVDAVDSAQQAILSTAYTQVADKTINDSLSLSSVKKAEVELKKLQEALATMSKRAAKVQELVKANEEAAKSEEPAEEKKEKAGKKKRNLTKESAEENPIEEEKKEEEKKEKVKKDDSLVNTVKDSVEDNTIPVNQSQAERTKVDTAPGAYSNVTYKQVETEPRGKGGAPQTKFDSNGLPFLITELVGQGGYPNTVTFADWVTTEMFKLEEEFKKGNYGFVYEYLDISNIHGAKTTVEERPIKAVVVKFNPDGTYTKISHNGNEVFAWVKVVNTSKDGHADVLAFRKLLSKKLSAGEAHVEKITGYSPYHHFSRAKEGTNATSLQEAIDKTAGTIEFLNSLGDPVTSVADVHLAINTTSGNYLNKSKTDFIPKGCVYTFVKIPGIAQPVALALDTRRISKAEARGFAFALAAYIPRGAALGTKIKVDTYDVSTKKTGTEMVNLLDYLDALVPSKGVLKGENFYGIRIELATKDNPVSTLIIGDGKSKTPLEIPIPSSKEDLMDFINTVTEEVSKLTYKVASPQKGKTTRKIIAQEVLGSPVPGLLLVKYPTTSSMYLSGVQAVVNGTEFKSGPIVTTNLDLRKPLVQPTLKTSPVEAESVKTGTTAPVSDIEAEKQKITPSEFEELVRLAEFFLENPKEPTVARSVIVKYPELFKAVTELAALEGAASTVVESVPLPQTPVGQPTAPTADKLDLDGRRPVTGKGRRKLRIASRTASKVSSVEEMSNNLKKILPSGIPVHVVKALLSIAGTDARAWGAVRNGALYISEQAEAGTEYHEAFHAIFNYAISKDLQSLLIKDFEKRFSKEELESKAAKKVKEGYTRAEAIEELIADAFMDYMMSDGKVKLPEIQKNIFQKIWDFIKSIVNLIKGNKAEDLNKLFAKIAKGQFTTSEINITDVSKESLRRVESPTNPTEFLTETETRQIATDLARAMVGAFVNQGTFEVAKMTKVESAKVLRNVIENLRREYESMYNNKELDERIRRVYKIAANNIIHEDPNSDQDLVYAAESILRERGIKLHVRNVLNGDVKSSEDDVATITSEPISLDEEVQEGDSKDPVDKSPTMKGASDLNIEEAFSIDRSKKASGAVRFLFAFVEDVEVIDGEYFIKEHPETTQVVYKDPADVWKDLNRALSGIDNSEEFFQKFLESKELVTLHPYLYNIRKRINRIVSKENTLLSEEDKVLYLNKFWKSLQGFIAEFKVDKVTYGGSYSESVGEGAIKYKQVSEWTENLKTTPFVKSSNTGELIMDFEALTEAYKKDGIEEILKNVAAHINRESSEAIDDSNDINEIASYVKSLIENYMTEEIDGVKYLHLLPRLGIKVELSQVVSYVTNIIQNPSSLEDVTISEEETAIGEEKLSQEEKSFIAQKRALKRLLFGIRDNIKRIVQEGPVNKVKKDGKDTVVDSDDSEDGSEFQMYTADDFLASRKEAAGIYKAVRFFAAMQGRNNSKFYDLSHYNVERKLTFSKQLFSNQQAMLEQMKSFRLSENSEARKVARVLTSLFGKRSFFIKKNINTDTSLSADIGIAVAEGISTEFVGNKTLGIKSADLGALDKLAEICNGVLNPNNRTLPHNIPGDSGTHYVWSNVPEDLLFKVSASYDAATGKVSILSDDATAKDLFSNKALYRSYIYFLGEYYRSVIINLAYSDLIKPEKRYSNEKTIAAKAWLEKNFQDKLKDYRGGVDEYLQEFRESCKLTTKDLNRKNSGANLLIYGTPELQGYIDSLETVELADENKEVIFRLIAKNIEDRLSESVEFALEEGYLTVDKGEIKFSYPKALPRGLPSASDIERFVFSMLNSHFSYVEEYTMTIGDLMWYKDPFKRFKSQAAYGSIVATDRRTGEAAYNKFYANSPNFKDKTSLLDQRRIMSAAGSFKTVTSNDIKTAYRRMAEAYKKEVEALLRSRVGVSEEYINSVINNIDSKFSDIESADGASFCTLEFYGDYHWRLGEWSDELDKAYNKAMNPSSEGSLSTELDDQVINVFKPVGVGEAFENPDLTSGDAFNLLNPKYFKKTSVFPITPALAKMMAERNDEFKDDTFQKMLDYMYSTNTDIISLPSAEKAAHINVVDIFDIDGDNNISVKKDLKDGGYYGDLRDLRLQVETAKELKVKTLLGTQAAKIILGNLFEDGALMNHWKDQQVKVAGKVMHIKEAIQLYHEVRRELAVKGIAEISKEFGLKVVIDEETGEIDTTKAVVSHPSTFVKALKEHMRDEYPQNIIDSIEVIKVNGIERVNLSALVKKERVENLIHSLITKAAVKHKLTGSPAVQVPGMGFAKTRVYKSKDFEAKYGYSRSKKLSFYGIIDKDGVQKVKAMQILLPFRFKKLFKDAGFTEEDLKKVFTDSEALFNPELKKALTLVGVRIPTQSLNSIESMEIAGFLPDEYGDIVVVPDQLPAKAGSDFDIDKLMMYFYSAVKGKVHNISTSNVQASSKEALGNYIVDFYKAVLSNPQSLPDMITPNSSKDLEDSVNKVMSQRGMSEEVAERRDLPFYKIPWVHTQIKVFKGATGGKDGVGIVALHITHHVLSQVAGLKITSKKELILDLASEKINISPTESVYPYSMGRYTDNQGFVISDVLSQDMNVNVDAGKDDFVIWFGNINEYTHNQALLGVRLGLGKDYVLNLTSSPIIKTLTKSLATRNSIQSYQEKGRKKKYVTTIKDSINEFIDAYAVNPEEARKIVSSNLSISKKGEVSLVKGLGKLTLKEMESLNASMKKNGGKLDADGILTSIKAFVAFNELTDMQQELFNLMMSNNADTKGADKNSSAVGLQLKKFNEVYRGKKRKDYNFINHDRILNESPLGLLRELTQELTSKLDGELFVTADGLYKEIENMIMSTLGGDRSKFLKAEDITQIKIAYFNYLISTFGPKELSDRDTVRDILYTSWSGEPVDQSIVSDTLRTALQKARAYRESKGYKTMYIPIMVGTDSLEKALDKALKDGSITIDERSRISLENVDRVYVYKGGNKKAAASAMKHFPGKIKIEGKEKTEDRVKAVDLENTDVVEQVLGYDKSKSSKDPILNAIRTKNKNAPIMFLEIPLSDLNVISEVSKPSTSRALYNIWSMERDAHPELYDIINVNSTIFGKASNNGIFKVKMSTNVWLPDSMGVYRTTENSRISDIAAEWERLILDHGDLVIPESLCNRENYTLGQFLTEIAAYSFLKTGGAYSYDMFLDYLPKSLQSKFFGEPLKEYLEKGLSEEEKEKAVDYIFKTLSSNENMIPSTWVRKKGRDTLATLGGEIADKEGVEYVYNEDGKVVGIAFTKGLPADFIAANYISAGMVIGRKGSKRKVNTLFARVGTSNVFKIIPKVETYNFYEGAYSMEDSLVGYNNPGINTEAEEKIESLAAKYTGKRKTRYSLEDYSVSLLELRNAEKEAGIKAMNTLLSKALEGASEKAAEKIKEEFSSIKSRRVPISKKLEMLEEFVKQCKL